MSRFKNFFKKHNFLAIILISLFFGLAGSSLSLWLAKDYLLGSFYNLAGKYPEQGLVISNAKNVIVQQDIKIEETINSVSGSLVGIYKKQKSVKPGDVFAPENFYKMNEPAGQGFIITADGWIVTNLALGKNYADYAVITADKKIYAIDRAAKDNLTEFTFIQVSARDLPVRKLAESQDIKRGSAVVSVNWQGLSWVSAVAGFRQSGGLVKSSDDFSSKMILNGNVPAEFKGVVVFNLAGDALGLIESGGGIEPVIHLAGATKNLFLNKTARRPSLGVNYINLAQLAALDGQSGAWQKGVIIYRDQKGAAVIKNSPADKAGLREGDIISAVDNVSLSKSNDLAEIIQSHIPGDKVVISYMRGGEEKEAAVILAEQKQ